MKTLAKQLGILLILIAIILSGNSCSKDNDNPNENDPCREEFVGEYFLLENARNSIPYNQDLLIYFNDSIGNQVVFEIKMDNKGLEPINYSMQIPCEFDKSREKIYLAKGEGFLYFIEDPLDSLGISFTLRVSNSFNALDSVRVFDNLMLHMDNSPDNNTSDDYISFIVNERELTDDQIAMYPLPIEEVTLLNKTFNGVYTNSAGKTFYNYAVGLIGFRDKTDNLWVFEKTEEMEK